MKSPDARNRPPGSAPLGRIHSFESFGAADGPGVRFVVFLSGCPLRCAYCHNPDTWARPEAFRLSPRETLDRALRFRDYWGEEGGLTVSGGEPLLQPDFVSELFSLARSEGVRTCLDTAARPFRQAPEWLARFDRLLDVTDLVLLDIKHIDEAAHRALTGSGNGPVLACARHLSGRGVPVWIRHVLVPGRTDDPAALRRLAAFVSSLRNVRRVEVLPYHAFGVAKWRALSLPYALEGVPPPSAAALAAARRILGA